jgi:hypothetical protein
MMSLFDELEARLAKDPRLTKRGGPRVDIGLLLFNARADIRQLWHAATAMAEGREATSELATAVEALRPIFGVRT